MNPAYIRSEKDCLHCRLRVPVRMSVLAAARFLALRQSRVSVPGAVAVGAAVVGGVVARTGFWKPGK